ncbi:hypothetical protein GWI33_001117 [Rhynchophorus ferrugineus]|uniref:Uncharacterized protein n=1 Tax=Rhynchophorus ferrugineus TaxID=354439 RepID=A0A834HLF1_RHYFE|nr:hypothetical protein GWI33_001117 [Rhynchophorus ferrugineus]
MWCRVRVSNATDLLRSPPDRLEPLLLHIFLRDLAPPRTDRCIISIRRLPSYCPDAANHPTGNRRPFDRTNSRGGREKSWENARNIGEKIGGE